MALKTPQRWGLALLMLAAFGLGGVASLPTVAQSGCSNFEATGQEVCFDFLDYWREHGGLAQQGYPITGRLQEISPTDGKEYMVQYFERAVFELHTENEPANRVLLSLLGAFAYRDRYPNGATGQQPNNEAGSRLFQETGKRLGGRFLAYWQEHGGLAQQGYPISDEFVEKSGLDGKEYRVQYFERAVFEYHPENQPPYDVLLSQLGTLRKQERAGRTVEFSTEDGVNLVGSLYGEGKTAVILSAMCSDTGKEDWTDFALLLKKRGYMALTYYYRGIKPSGGARVVTREDKDIAAAVQYVKRQGAERLVLVGASCGGTISTIEATKTKVDGLVVIASPGNIEGMGATDEALETVTAPKLFISSEGDQWTGPMLELYDKMPDPKEKHIYTGSVHGTGLFYTEHGADLTQRLIGFVERSAPAK